jgi:two-component system NtrC family sensor kinase
VGEIGLAQVGVVVNRAVQLMQHHFKISNVRFEQSLDAQDMTLMCDEDQIQQALVALFVNAVEAMPKGGTLRLHTTRSASGELVMRVSDTGSGIAPEDLEHVFEPFFTTKKEGKGVGLGLSVVFGIIDRHGGNISVQSEPGQGTTFTIVFPPPAMHHPRVEPPGESASRSSA